MKRAILGLAMVSAVVLAGYIVMPIGGEKTASAFLDGYNNMRADGDYGGKQLFKELYTVLQHNLTEESTSVAKKEADLPSSLDVDMWVAYTQASTMSESRKKSVLEGLDTIKKGCIYHGLRGNGQTPSRCAIGGCDSQKTAQAYDYVTQADYRVTDPLYLDCSYFVKHCWYMGGVSVKSSSTSGFTSELITIAFEDMIPGDVVLKRSGSSGHVRLFIGKQADGNYVFAEMMNHKNDSVLAAYSKEQMQSGGYTARRAPSLVSDTVYGLPMESH